MKKIFNFEIIIYALLLSIIANSYIIVWGNPLVLGITLAIFVIINATSGIFTCGAKHLRLRTCAHGYSLLASFALSVIASVIFHIVLAFVTIPNEYMTLIWSALFCIAAEAIVFWNGITCVYLTSYQLGIKLRVIGAILGIIPIVNLFVLRKIMLTVLEEIKFELKKERLEFERLPLAPCKTKYPILLVHGFFFRDFKYFNYWGRIPKTLTRAGATIYYGNHQSARPVADSAEELAARIKRIVEETGCEKLNVIAHSKGGLDMRYAISKLGMDKYVASLTTVNTPHRGCIYADKLLETIPKTIQSGIARTYNKAMLKLGDENPDFLAAARDLTAGACEKLNAEIPTIPSEIYCRSIGSVMNGPADGSFPLSLSYHIVSHYDGEKNDGLVSESSFKFGENYTLISPDGRGISHCDVIDLSRKNVKEFDVREFYVELVSDLKSRGL